MSKIVYNKVIHDVLSKLIDFNPSKDNLKKSTDDVLKGIFNIRDEVIYGRKEDKSTEQKEIKVEKTTDKKEIEDKNQDISSREGEVKENPTQEKIKTDIPPPPQDEPKPHNQDEKRSDESLKLVLWIYISEHTDLETRIAYLKSFASPELLKSVEEQLRKREHDDYVKMVQTACEIVKEEEIANEIHGQGTDKRQNSEEPLDQDLFDEDDFRNLEKANDILKDFDHEKDDHLEAIMKHSENVENLMPVLYLLKEFKNIVEKKDDQSLKSYLEGEKQGHHSNKFVASLYAKYDNSSPEEKDILIRKLEILNAKLQLQKEEKQAKGSSHSQKQKTETKNVMQR